MGSEKIVIGLTTLLLGTCMADQCIVNGIEDRLDTLNASVKYLPSETTVTKLNGNLDAIDQTLKDGYRTFRDSVPKPMLHNVIGKEEPDEFYHINGQRAYIAIDGLPVECYLKENKSLAICKDELFHYQ